MNRDATSPGVDAALIEQLDQIITQLGGNADDLSGKLIREMMHTALKLIEDKSDTGELKLLNRSLKEMRYAMKVFRPYRDVRKISVFGSARTPVDHPHFLAAEAFSRLISFKGWMVITGAGGGIMHAGHGGAGREASFGVAIRLPFETTANEIIAGDEKLVTFRYFFTRKLMFVSQADALAMFPGGFGTQDECFETLTLIQTGKSTAIPIVCIDSPDDDYWAKWDQYVRECLLKRGMISEEDLSLYKVTDNVQEAVDYILEFYRNYHSQRFVRDDLVLRMRRPLTERQIDALNDEFAAIIKQGRIYQTGPLEGETQHLNLPRLAFNFNRQSYARLRILIDRINAFDAKNESR
jgi:hypothetical protein